MGASIVRYEGFLTSGAASVAPSIRYDAASYSLGAQGGWTLFESGNRIVQASGAAAWISPARERLRLELGATGGVFRYAAEAASGHALARARVHLAGGRSGGWIGVNAGASFDTITRAPLQISLSSWMLRDRFALVGSASSTWLGDDYHFDISGVARWMTGRLDLETRLGLRPYARSRGNIGDALATGWIEVAASIPLRSNVALDLSGGSYPTDPVRRVLGATYATAGLRIDFARRPPLATLAIPSAGRDAATPRLELQGAVLRVFIGGARSVEVMGDFTDWSEVGLERAGDGIWELRMRLAPGVHRLNVRIDGGPWLVPAGARPEDGEFGDKVGVIVVR